MRRLSIIASIALIGLILLASCSNSEDLMRVMFFSSNWGDYSIKITDDILSLEDGSTATPREIKGDSTTITNPAVDSLAVDKGRAIIYMLDSDTGKVLVYDNASTVNGDIAPDRTIEITGATRLEGIDVFSDGIDRLFVGGDDGTGGHLWIFDNASTLNGSPIPDAVIDITIMSVFVDEENDLLYAGEEYDENNRIYVFENASSYTTGTAASRIITLTDDIDPTGLWVDQGSDRLFVCDNGGSSGDNYLFVFENASTMNGSYDPDTDSAARIDVQSISLMVDHMDNLYAWTDSADHVKIYYNASTLSGDISGPDKTVYGVVSSGYGMDYIPF
jgi:hypothetical protein